MSSQQPEILPAGPGMQEGRDGPPEPEAADSPGSAGGRTAALVAGVLVVVVAVAAGTWFLLRGDGEPVRYRLAAPAKVAGEYARDGAASSNDGSAFKDSRVPGMTTRAGVTAKYKSGMLKQLQLGGAWGRVARPAKAVDWVFTHTTDGLKQSTGATAQGAPRSFRPKGFDGTVLKCQKYTVESMGLGVCVWGDPSTVGTVSSFELVRGDRTRPVDLARTAALTAKVRKEALVPIKPKDD
jgi:hypothetical protein